MRPTRDRLRKLEKQAGAHGRRLVALFETDSGGFQDVLTGNEYPSEKAARAVFADTKRHYVVVFDNDDSKL